MGDAGTASAFLSCPETQAQSWGNEAAATADTDNVIKTLFRACSVQVPSTLQTAFHALPYLNRQDSPPNWYCPSLTAEGTEAQRG